MKNHLIIRNTSKVQQYVIFEGERYQMPPFETIIVKKDLGECFITDCAPHVVITDGDGEYDSEAVGHADILWLANTTGNPDAPETVRVTKRSKDGRIEVDLVNPNKRPRTLLYTLTGGQVPGLEKSGAETVFNAPARKITVAPFARKAFRPTTARRLLELDANCAEEVTGCLKLARPPQHFEPNKAWGTKRLKAYAAVIDPRIPLNETAGEGESEDDVVARIYRRVWLRQVNPQWRLPEKDQFEAFMAAQETKERHARVDAERAEEAARAADVPAEEVGESNAEM